MAITTINPSVSTDDERSSSSYSGSSNQEEPESPLIKTPALHSSSAPAVTPCQNVFRMPTTRNSYEQTESNNSTTNNELYKCGVVSFSSSDEDDEDMEINKPLDYRLDWAQNSNSNSLRDLCKSLFRDCSGPSSTDMMECESVHSIDMDAESFQEDDWRRESVSDWVDDDEICW